MPLPEDFDILFFGESGGRRKSKKSVKFIAVISAVCAAVAVAVLVIRHNAKKTKVWAMKKTAHKRDWKAWPKFSYTCRSGERYGNFNFYILLKSPKDEISDHTVGAKNTYSQRSIPWISALRKNGGRSEVNFSELAKEGVTTVFLILSVTFLSYLLILFLKGGYYHCTFFP